MYEMYFILLIEYEIACNGWIKWLRVERGLIYLFI